MLFVIIIFILIKYIYCKGVRHSANMSELTNHSFKRRFCYFLFLIRFKKSVFRLNTPFSTH